MQQNLSYSNFAKAYLFILESAVTALIRCDVLSRTQTYTTNIFQERKQQTLFLNQVR